jgi:AraC-like DNA-binding protein
MESRPILDILGLLVSLAMAFAVLVLSRRRPVQRPFLALLFLEAALFFLADFLAARGIAAGIAFALSLGSNFYGVPALFFFAQESLGYRPRRILPQFIPAAIAATAGTALAAAAAANGFHGGLPLAIYMVLVPLVQTVQLVLYGRAGLRLSASGPSPGRPNWPRRAIVAALAGYGVFVAISWIGIGAIMASELLDRPIGQIPGIDVSSSLVAVFLVWTLGLCALWSTEAAGMASSKYGGKNLAEGDRAMVMKRLRALLSASADLSAEEVSPRRLAQRLGEPYYLVSRVVNEAEGKTVADLVNEYRVERAKRLLQARPQETILEIAMDSGFQAKSTFNEVFRKTVGATPTEYRRGLPG